MHLIKAKVVFIFQCHGIKIESKKEGDLESGVIKYQIAMT